MKLKSILIVDDSDSDQYLTKHLFEEYDKDIQIFQAYDGEEALQMLKAMNEVPSLILLDINMPRMDGFEFLDNYKDENASVVIMLSSSDQDRDKKKALSYDLVKHYVVKPLEIEDLESWDLSEFL